MYRIRHADLSRDGHARFVNLVPVSGQGRGSFLRKALIHDAQTRSFGELSPDLKRALKAAATGNHTNGLSY